MAQELEDLLIKVDSELGDLSGIDSAIGALDSLAQFSAKASRGAGSLEKMSSALTQLNAFGKSKLNTDKLVKDIEKLKGSLASLAEFTKDASASIKQLDSLGKALGSFTDVGKNLAGINEVVKGIEKMVGVLERLSKVEKDSSQGIKNFKSLGTALHSFNGLDDNVKSLNDIALGIINLGKALESLKGLERSDFGFLKTLGGSLNDMIKAMDGTTRIWSTVGEVTNGITGLIHALKGTEKVNVGHIGAIAEELKKFNDPAIIGNANQLNGTLRHLTEALTQLNQSSNLAHNTMDKLIHGFSDADRGFYNIRSSIEAISTDLTDALKPVRNSDLFDTLERFKHLNDSYKNVGGLGQGLGSLISALDMLDGRDLQTYGITQLLDYFKALAKDKSVEEATQQMEKVGNLAQPIASLVNALKYTDFDDKNNVLTVLGDQINKFYSKLPNNFDKLSYVMYALRDLIQLASDAKAFGVEIPEDNVISQISKSLAGFKDLPNVKEIGTFIEAIHSLVTYLTSTQEALKHTGDGAKSYWEDAIDVTPILKVAEALKSLQGLGQNLASFKTFRDTLMGFMRFNVRNLNGVNLVLEGIFETMQKIPEGRGDTLKGLASSIRALDKLQNIDPNQLNLIADGLTKILTALGGIQGSNNRISIRLDSSGVANFQQIAQKTHRTWDDFYNQLEEDLKNIDMSSMFDLSAPLNGLKKQLNEAERMLHQRMKTMYEENAKMQQSRQTNANYENDRTFQIQAGKFARAKVEAQQLKDIIEQINKAMLDAPRFGNDAEGHKYLHSLREEYERYQKFMERFNRGADADPSTRIGHVFEVVQERMEYLKDEIARATENLDEMETTLEGVAEEARLGADELERMADEAERASQEMRGNIGEGFSKFGSMLTGSKNGVLSSFGNLSNMFGKAVKDGTAILGDTQLASLESLAGTLGTVATAVGQVGAVIGVVVAVFKAWWDTMEKVKDALVKFVQSCAQFAKNMLTTVVGAFNAVAGAVSKVVSAVRSGAEAIVVALRKIRDFGSGVISIFGKLGNAFAPAVKGIKAVLSAVTPKFVRTLASSNFQLSKLVKNTHLLKNAVKAIQRYFSMLTRMLMRKSITAFLNQMKQAFEDMVLFEKNADDAMLQLNYNVSIVFSEFRRLANQVMAIFEPLMNALAVPAQSFLATLTAMAENMAKFMAIMTGQPYYLRAKRFYEDYGKNVEDTNKKVKNLTNGLDELNILSANKDEETFPSPEDMIEEVPIDNFDFGLPALKDIIDKIVDFLMNIDWESLWEKIKAFIDRIMDYVNYILSRLDLAEWLGKTLGNLVNTVFVILEELGNKFDPHALAEWLSTLIINALNEIDWDRINRVVETWASKLAQFWNDIFANDELWNAITNTITNFLNEVVHYFDTWAWTFDFSQMAQTLTDAVTRILQGFDWEQLRHAVEGWVTGLVDFINTAMANEEFWTTIGDSIARFVNIVIDAFNKLGDIDFAQAVESLKLAIETFLDGIDWDSFWQAIDKWAQNIADVVNGLLADEEFLTKVTTSIAQFINGIIELFDEALIKLQGYDIGTAIANALISGLEDIHWNTLFMLPADALNALSNALRGILDAIPADFNLGTWLTEHLSLTIDTVNWEELEKNISDFAKKLSDWIDGVLSDEEFWAKFGQATGRVIRIGLDFIFEIFNVNGEDLGTAIVNYINGLIGEVNVGKYISKTVDVFVNLVVALDTVFTGVNWDEIGDQIAQGIVDGINKLFANRELIRKTIEDAFNVASTLLNKVLVKMIDNDSFYKLGQIVGDIILSVITGISSLLDDNLDNILTAMQQLGDSIADFLHKNRNKIVTKLNKIIDAIVAIIDAFFDEKSKLWSELTEIVKRLNLGKLIGALVGGLITKLAEAFEMNSAIFESLSTHIGDFLFEIGKAIGRLFKNKINELFKGIMFTIFGGSVGGGMLWKLFSKILFGNNEAGEKKSLLAKVGDAWNDFWSKMPWNKDKEKTTIPVTIEPEIEEDTDWSFGDYFDKTKKVPIELEDPELGTITASTIDVTVLKATTFEIKEIYAEILTVVDIFADKLHVGEIDSDMSGNTVNKDAEKFYGGNEANVNTGTLSKDLTVENIFAQLLDVKKILSELLEVGEKIMTPLLEVSEKITTPLIDAKKITTKLLDAKKIVTKLLEAEKMWTKFLEVRDEILTQELKVEKKTTTKLFEIDRVSVKDNGLGNFTASIDNLDKLFVPLIEALKLAVEEFEANTMALQTLKVTIFTAKGLDVDAINAQTLNLGQIIANTLRVGSIVSGGGLGLTNVIDNGYNEHGGEYYIEKPQFAQDDRWSDISGLVPSAEDFLRGFNDVYKGVYDGVYDSYQKTVGTVTQPVNLGDYSTGITQGTLSNDGTQGVWVSNHIGANGSVWNQTDGSYSTVKLDDEAQARYIRDYLMKEIGNEAGVYGLMGNLYAESGLKSNNLQDTNGNLGVTQKDIDYTNSINNGANFLDNKGYGLAQWTTSDRKKKLQDSLGGSSIDDLDGQLAYLVKELKTDFPNVWNSLKNASSNYEASTAVLEGFEKPKNASDKISERASYSNQIAGILGDDNYNIPDEPVPTTDTPQDNEPNLYDGFDEAHVVDITDDGSNGYGGTPFSFLETLPIQTEFVMARVYNIIDKWLGRIYRLFKSFNVDEFLKDLVDLDEIELDLDGKLKLDVFDNIEKALKKLIELIEQLIKDGIKCTCDCKCDGGADIYDDLVNALHDCGFPADDTHLKNNTDAKSKNTKAVESLNKLIREGGLVCNCNCKSDGGASAYDDIVHAMHDCGFPADDTHLRNNTDAKSKNTKAVEGLNNTMNRMADCCQNNYAMTERMVGAIGDWIRCAGDTGHLDNNTKAKSDNTRAIEDLNRNIGGFISNLQGTLSNVTCNCNCGGNCGNCAVGQSGGSGGDYTPPNNGGGYVNNGGYVDNNGGNTTNHTNDNYYDNNVQQADGGVVDRNGGKPSDNTGGQPQNNDNGNGGKQNNNDGGNDNSNNNNDNNGGGNDNNGNNNDRGVDPKTGIPYGLAPTFDARTGLITFTDNEGNLFPEYGQRKVKNFGDDLNAEWATGFFEADFNREQEEKRKAEEAQKKRVEEAQKKAEQQREENNKKIPAVDPYVIGEGGLRDTTSDTYKALKDKKNQEVEELRKKGKAFLDNVNQYGSDAEKATAKSYYDSLMTNTGAFTTSSYEWYANKLDEMSSKLVTKNALGSDYGDVRLGANGQILSITDWMKLGDIGKQVLANALVSDRDSAGKPIYWYMKGNGTKNSAQVSDRITDTNVITSLRSGIKKLGITEDMATVTKKTNSTPSTEPLTDEQKALQFRNEFRDAVDAGKEIALSYGHSSESSPFKDTEQLKKIFEGLRTTSWIGYKGDKGSIISSDTMSLPISDIKTMFDYWYNNRFLVKGYQLGGMPNAGEVFVARENGTPEYVGSFGNKTAVANNDQIVTAVANGVSMANDRVVNAIQSQTESLSNTIDRKDLNVQIGDRQIAEANNRGQRGLGNKFVE